MKYLVSFLLLFCGLSAFSQADTIFVLGAEFGATTEPTDSTFTVDIIHPTDQLGQAFTASKIQVGYRLIDVFGRLYRVKSVDATGIGSSTLTVVELQNGNAPSGTGLVYRKPDNSDCIPEIQTGDIGISYALAARIANHNAVVGCGGTGGGGTVETVVDGTGISVDATDAANPIVTNTAPDQTISLTGEGSVGITGSYPSFTVTGSGVTGSGTVNSIPLFSSANVLSNSALAQIVDANQGPNIGINTASPRTSLEVQMSAPVFTSINLPGGIDRERVGLSIFSDPDIIQSQPGIVQYYLPADYTSNAVFSLSKVFTGTSEATAVQKGDFGIYTDNDGGAYYLYMTSAAGGNYATSATLKVDANNRIGVAMASDSRPSYTLDVGGTNPAMRLSPHDVTLTGAEGLLYADLSEKTFKGHNGTSFFRFMQQSTTIPTNGQIPVWNSTTGLYEPTTATPAQTPAPSSTADSIGSAGDIRYDDDYIYIKTSAGWKRSALSTF
jgi:hypothetical protein